MNGSELKRSNTLHEFVFFVRCKNRKFEIQNRNFRIFKSENRINVTPPMGTVIFRSHEKRCTFSVFGSYINNNYNGIPRESTNNRHNRRNDKLTKPTIKKNKKCLKNHTNRIFIPLLLTADNNNCFLGLAESGAVVKRMFNNTDTFELGRRYTSCNSIP